MYRFYGKIRFSRGSDVPLELSKDVSNVVFIIPC
jgi:hypothetical protein